MSDDEDEDDGDDRGCLLFIGLLIIGLAVGAIAGPAWGWLVVGIIIVIAVIMSR